jgi:dTDP-4-amino-4,6-dideoxygalactose transaminase
MNIFKNILGILVRFDLKFFLKLLKIVIKKDYSKYPTYVHNFEKSISQKFNIKHCLTFSSGTAAFYASILSLNLKKNSKVLISSLTFPTIIKILKKFDFDIYYFNINKNFEIINNSFKNQNYDLLVMTHPFGFYIDCKILKPFLTKNTKVILDTSHSQGMIINNNYLINYADVSFMSLQGNKAISGGEGGIILTNDTNLFLQMIDNHHPGHKKNNKIEIAGGVNDLKLRMHPLAALFAHNDLNSFEERNEKLKKKIQSIYEILDKLQIKHPYNKKSIISGFHFGVPFFFGNKINSNIIKKYNWYTDFKSLNIKSTSQHDITNFFNDLCFIDLEWIKNNPVSRIENIILKTFRDAH